MNSTEKTLDQVCDALKTSVDKMRGTLTDIRAAIAPETRQERNIRVANETLKRYRYMDESVHTLQQWGILDAETDEQVIHIINEVIDYRLDAMLHYTGQSNF